MDADQLHRDALVIDGHNDTIVSSIRLGHLDLCGEANPRLARLEGLIHLLRGPLPAEEREWHGQVDLAKLRAGGIDAAFFAVDVTRAWRNHLAYAMDALGFFDAALEACGEQIVVARTAAEIQAAKATGRIAAVLVIENSDAVEGSLNILRAFHRLGVRSIVLTHNPSSWAAAWNAEARSGGG